MAKKLLLTGFDPFGGESVNPAWEAVSRVSDRVGDFEITKLMVPTVFGKAGETVSKKADEIGADVVLCVGQAGGREAVTPEMVGINLRYGRIQDNEGNAPQDEPVVEKGPAAIFTTLPARAMAAAINEAGVAGKLSLSAGAFVCNDLLYSMLYYFHGTQTRVGFIHVPYLPEQAKNGEPSMERADIIKALEAAIAAIE
ncbi:MAG: pyroglutamyl-peptidase I [Firmicutes bacterium]|nr:pyroglutamyl-peptidase I [Bacillota bacterium]